MVPARFFHWPNTYNSTLMDVKRVVICMILGAMVLAANGCSLGRYDPFPIQNSASDRQKDKDPLERIFPKGALVTEHGSEKMKREEYSALSEQHRYQVETGKIDGVRYRLYKSDGSGSVQGLPDNTLESLRELGTNWDVVTSADLINDTHQAKIGRGDVAITRTNQERTYFWVGHDHYPGSEMVVRIDDNSPIRASADDGFTTEQVKKILKQMRHGETIATRYMEWPHERFKDDQWRIFGFDAAMHVAKWIVKNLDRERYAAANRDE